CRCVSRCSPRSGPPCRGPSRAGRRCGWRCTRTARGSPRGVGRAAAWPPWARAAGCSSAYVSLVFAYIVEFALFGAIEERVPLVLVVDEYPPLGVVCHAHEEPAF